MQLEKIVSEKFSEIIESGFVEQKIKEQLETTMENIIRDSLRSYSDFGKRIEKEVKKAIKIESLNLSLPEYNQLVSNWIVEIVNRTIIEDSKKQIEANIQKFFIPLEKDEYRITEIIENFKESLIKDDEYCEGEISFYCKESSVSDGYFTIRFDKEANMREYSCDYSISVNDRGLWNMKINGEDVDKMKNPVLYNFDRFLFQLFASKVKIINDSNDVDVYYSGCED